MIFAEVQRTNAAPKLDRESAFAFLDRSSRPEIERVRILLEGLAANYPMQEQKELVARIRCGNDVEFNSAVFELLLHGLLRKLGYTLVPHPELPASSSHPDFLVTAPGGEEFYLEAVLASPDDGREPGGEARIGTALDALAEGGHANFRVHVRSYGMPTTQPSRRRLRSDVLAWLDTLDPDEAGVESAIFSWSHEAWTVTFRPIPIPLHRRGKAERLIGTVGSGVRWVDEWSPIRDAVRLKGRKYGHPEKPLLIAVNFSGFNLSRIDEMQALFGQEQFVFAPDRAMSEPSFARAGNGAWLGPGGPQSRRVSGVWLFNDLTAYTVANRQSTIYFHPWANHPLPGILRQFPHAILAGERMRWAEGVGLREAFDLHEGWPE